jgi:hypothetical protein
MVRKTGLAIVELYLVTFGFCKYFEIRQFSNFGQSLVGFGFNSFSLWVQFSSGSMSIRFNSLWVQFILFGFIVVSRVQFSSGSMSIGFNSLWVQFILFGFIVVSRCQIRHVYYYLT